MRVFLFTLMLLSALPVQQSLIAQTATRGLKPQVSITVEGEWRIIRANGLPDHQTGQFPGRGNPNSIAAQQYEFRVRARPHPAEQLTPLRMQPFGVAVNGVVFDPGAAEWWNGDRNWQYEALVNGPGFLGIDQSHAHVQPTGAYHYHGVPTALVHALTDGKQTMVIVGWAADGFPIYNDLGHTDPKDARSPLKKLRSSYQIKKGERPSGPRGKYDGSFVADYEYVAGSGDLDECNGRFAVTPDYPDGIYHYVLTEQFPSIPRMYRGTPDQSFNTHGPGAAGGPATGGPGTRPLPAIVRALDANCDGAISQEEMEKATASLKSLDKNGDGHLTREEYLGARPAGGPGPEGQGPGGQRPR